MLLPSERVVLREVDTTLYIFEIRVTTIDRNISFHFKKCLKIYMNSFLLIWNEGLALLWREGGKFKSIPLRRLLFGDKDKNQAVRYLRMSKTSFR